MSAVGISIIPLILWYRKHGTIFPPDWRVSLFCVALVFACALLPVGTQARTGLACLFILAILSLRAVKNCFLLLAAPGLPPIDAIALPPQPLSTALGQHPTTQPRTP